MNNERILILDRDSQTRATLGEYLSSLGYPHEYAGEVTEAIRKINKEGFALAFVDSLASRAESETPVEQLREASPLTVVVATGQTESLENVLGAIRAGATDFLRKPIDTQALTGALERGLRRRLELVRTHQQLRPMEMKIERRTRELSEIYQETIQALGSALDTRDPETQEHAIRVVHYTVQIAEAMDISGNPLREIERGSVLHDVGKIGVPDGILFKPGKLTSSEWLCMKTHTEIGTTMLNSIRFLKSATSIVRSHHEHFNGKGYPDGISGKDIPIGARIFSIADSLDAMTSDRPYSRARSMEAAMEEIIKCQGSQFDPEIVGIFLSLVESGKWNGLSSPVDGKHADVPNGILTLKPAHRAAA